MGLSAQQILQSDPEYLQRQLAAQEQQRVNPTGSAAGALGALLGRGLSNISQGKGFFQAPDYGLQRVAGVQGIMRSVQFDPNNPAEYYNQVGRALQEAGYADLAPMAFTEARKLQVQDRELSMRERGVKQAEERIGIERERLKADLAKEERQGLLTKAQIRQIDAQIANLGSAYEYQVLKGPAGETTGILAINKKDPNDVKQIQLGETAAPAASATGGGATWNYVPGQGMVKAP